MRWVGDAREAHWEREERGIHSVKTGSRMEMETSLERGT